ncbi:MULTISPECIES: DCC1-like thiol-disulfide oxidoreductase family protein [Natrialbaceae]|uniref:DCC1-like thiol-disulfide oxidoreductase family protein n=1 Tax=Natrialbaceae TaxID=1644061 RepID=UPI00207D3B41|nr:DCC1-like thiol-disulfide oxidoreductase family protein [Natronococcus sp. CG52]
MIGFWSKTRSLTVNYWSHDQRPSPINLAVFRIIIGTYIIWKVTSLNWKVLTEWPSVPVNRYGLLRSTFLLELLPFIVWTTVLIACLFIIGYRLRIVSFLFAFSLAYLGAHRFVYNASGGTESLFIAVLFISIFGLYAETDPLTIDGIRQTSDQSLSELNNHLQTSNKGSYPMTILKSSLLIVAIIYFGSGIGKIIGGPLWNWIQPDTTIRFITYRNEIDSLARPIGEVITTFPLISALSAISTILLEAGFLVAIFLGLSITPFVIGLFGMHGIIGLALGPFFFDQMIFLSLFLAWDKGYARIVSDRKLDIVYDEHCYMCARSLYIFKILDINDNLLFYTQTTAPEEYTDQEEIQLDERMYVFNDGANYGGYWAFRELLRQFRIFAPVVWIMGLAPVVWVGEPIYEYIAENRDRYFVCSYEPDDQS